MPYIRLDEIEFSIGSRVLLDRVKLSLDKGEKLGLLGRNGAGKSTYSKFCPERSCPMMACAGSTLTLPLHG